MTRAADLRGLAERVIEAQDRSVQLTPFSASGPTLSMQDAYEVSWLVHEHRLASGWKAIGRKIGFTNRDMWALFGVTQPVWAFVYDRTCEDVDTQVECPLAGLVEPRIEPEIVFRLREVPRTDADEAEVLDAIEWMAHGIEMVQCHYPGWRFASIDAVCDSSFHGRLYVGPHHPVGTDRADVVELLKTFELALWREDEPVEIGHGRNVLDSPLLAVTSLVDVVQREGSPYPLSAGEIVTTGTITRAYAVHATERWRTAIDHAAFAGLEIAFT